MSREIPWPRILVEGAVIVASILLALAVESWWDAVQEREETRQDLISVAQELAENRALVQFEVDFAARLAAGSASIVATLESVPTGSVVAIADTTVFLGTTPPSTLNASLGAVEALIASGRLARIEDPSVRSRLAGLRDRVEDATENQQPLYDITWNYLNPLIDSHTDNSLELAASISFWSQSSPAVEERSALSPIATRGQVDFPADLEILRFLRRRTQSLTFIGAEMVGLLAEIDELIALISELT